MEKMCPHCGSPLPEEAVFCPHCAESINKRSRFVLPRRLPVRILRRLLPVLFAVCLIGGLYLGTRPQNTDGMGEVLYSDSDGTYQLLLSRSLTEHYEPVTEIDLEAGDEERYRFPLLLYINHKDSGADAGGIFMQKVEKAEVSVEQPADSVSPVTCTEPAPNDYAPSAALLTLVDFYRDSPQAVQIVWTLQMKNGDRITLRTDLHITPIAIHEYSTENAELSDSASLQAPIDRIAQETDPKEIVKIYLPAVSYTETIILHDRAFNLIGSQEDGARTGFAGGIQMRKNEKWISYLTDLDFPGSGDGIGLSTAGRVWTKNCSFTNWKTGLLCYGNTWVNFTDCTFEGNGTGMHYNSTSGNANDSHFTDNRFTSNTTAVLLEQVPNAIQMNFSGSVFTGNGTDIDNRCEQNVDISEAVFQ